MQSDTTFVIDLEQGEAVERRLAVLLVQRGRHKAVDKVTGYCKEYDLVADNGERYEVKFDRYAMEKRSTNLAFEYFYQGKPSDISTTPAQFWAHYDGTFFYILAVAPFKDWIVMNKLYLRKVKSGVGAQSILIPSKSLCGLYFCDMIRDVASVA